MYKLYLVSVYCHVIAATVWLGGMGFLVLVVVPWMRGGERALGAKILRETGTRFRDVAWTCFAVVLVTGTFNLRFRGVRFASFASPDFYASVFGHAVVTKLALFGLVVALSAYHDFVLGPAATSALMKAPASPEAERLRKRASTMGRLTALLALALFGAGVVLVRGCG